MRVCYNKLRKGFIMARPRVSLKEKLRVKIEKTDTCWLWTGFIDKYGYGSIMEFGKRIGAHRAAWMVCNGVIPSGMQVLHKCDVRHCVNPDHLFIGTHADNHKDKVKKGRVAWGEKHWHCKVLNKDVEFIIKSVFSSRILSEMFNITRNHVNYLKRGYRRTPECNKK